MAAPHDSGTLDAGHEPIFWLRGGVVGCSCPECGSPMSVRLWLSMADCAACGCSIALTEEQEQEARALLAEYQRQQQAAAAPAPSPAPAPPPAAVPTPPAPAPAAVEPPAPALPAAPVIAKVEPEKPAPRPPEPAAPAPPAPAPVAKAAEPAPTEPPPEKKATATVRKPAPAPEPQPPVGANGKRRRVAEHDPTGLLRAARNYKPTVVSKALNWLKYVPAWLISLVVHLILVIILGLIYLHHEGRPHQFTLVARVSDADPVGPDDQSQEFFEVTEFQAPSDFQVDEVSPIEDPVQDDAPHELPTQVAELPVTFNPSDVGLPVASEQVVVGAVGSFDGRGERSRGQLVKAYGGTEESESAVAKGLRWLAKVQEPDGSWKLERWGGMRSDTAGTGLGLLPFLGAGQTHQSGQYQKTVYRALDWLKNNQEPNGDLRGEGNGVMYAHGICTIALCEAYALTRDPELRGPAQKAIDFIVHCQNPGGGWRYEPKQQGDTSVVGWQLMALRSAQMAYLDVPDDVIKRTIKFLDSVQENEPGQRYKGSRYAYQPGTGISEVMTAEAILCRQYTGWKRTEPAMGDAIRWLLSEHMPNGYGGFNIYYWYYGTQAMHHYGGEPWKQWNGRVRDLLVASQVRRTELEGSWEPRGQWGNQGGRIFTTSLAILTLEVYYRHLPLYDQVEKDVRGE